MQRLAVLAMIGSAAAWGGGTVMSKALLDEGLPPVTLLVVQLLASCTVLWLIVWGRRLPVRGRDVRAGWTGVLEPGLAYLIGLIGVQWTTASQASIISATEPVWVLCFAVLFLAERVSMRTVGLLGVSMLGVILVTGELSGTGGTWQGDAFVLIGTLAAAGYVISSRHSAQHSPPLVLAAMQQTVGLGVALCALPFSATIAPISGTALLGAIACGIVQYALAFSLYLTALRTIPATDPNFWRGGGDGFLGGTDGCRPVDWCDIGWAGTHRAETRALAPCSLCDRFAHKGLRVTVSQPAR
ncbi:MAG: DMT family transporter [Anaerolineae bacterium]|nr:DMT family transporter [Anaerolineae bacterium]